MPERPCVTCKFYAPWVKSVRLRDDYAKCSSPRVPLIRTTGRPIAEFAETVRGIPSMCGPDGLWWEPKPPAFEVVEDEPQLEWPEDEDET